MSAATQQIEEARARLIADRLLGIGGSDLGAVFSLAPYGCSRALVYEKRGEVPSHRFNGNSATERGLRLEAIAADVYAEQTGRQIRRVAGGLTGAAKKDAEFSFMVCHSDREILNSGRETPGLLSIKVPGREMFAKVKTEGIPHSWTLQLQYEMAIWNRSWGSYAIFHADSWSLIHFDVERDDALVAEIKTGVKALWEVIQNPDAPLPEKLDAKDPRCGRCPFRTGCQGQALVALSGKIEEGITIPFDPSLAELIQLRNEHADIADQASALLEETNAKIKEAMGDRQCVDTSGARIYYKITPGRESFQAKQYLKAHPNEREEMSKFTNQGAPFRTLKIYVK